MNNKKGIITKYVLTYFFLLVFCMIQANSAVFIHTHILPDGTRVFHAHPYHKHGKIPNNHHHHSNFELLLLSQANSYLLPENDINVTRLDVYFIMGNDQGTIYYISETCRFSSQRAPPFIS